MCNDFGQKTDRLMMTDRSVKNRFFALQWPFKVRSQVNESDSLANRYHNIIQSKQHHEMNVSKLSSIEIIRYIDEQLYYVKNKL